MGELRVVLFSICTISPLHNNIQYMSVFSLDKWQVFVFNMLLC